MLFTLLEKKLAIKISFPSVSDIANCSSHVHLYVTYIKLSVNFSVTAGPATVEDIQQSCLVDVSQFTL